MYATETAGGAADASIDTAPHRSVQDRSGDSVPAEEEPCSEPGTSAFWSQANRMTRLGLVPTVRPRRWWPDSEER